MSKSFIVNNACSEHFLLTYGFGPVILRDSVVLLLHSVWAYTKYITCPQLLTVILFFNKYLVDNERTSSAGSRVVMQSKRSQISLMTGVKSNISDLNKSNKEADNVKEKKGDGYLTEKLYAACCL